MATALITGASSGIGLELARVFAKEDHDVILVSRSEEALLSLADELQTQYGIRAFAIAQDLSKHNAGTKLFKKIQALNVSVDFLVNNAGFGLYGEFSETSLPRELDMIQLNIVAVTELTKHFLPLMIKQGHGRILNVASVAAFMPGPLMAVYFASKAYVLSFSEALATELKDSGVTVTALCPGFTTTGFQAAAEWKTSSLNDFTPSMGAQEVARAGYQAMLKGESIHVTGVTNKAITNSTRLLPRRWVSSMVKRFQAASTKSSN
jgi:short-subunit dehydrogenase